MDFLRARRLPILAASSILIRLATALLVKVVAGDGARDIRMARLIAEGRWYDSLAVYPTHPLHAFLTAGVDVFVRDLIVSAVAVSIVLGGLSIVPLYLLLRRAWNESVATIAAVLYVFLPAFVELHADAMTEGTFMFFFFSTMALGWSALEKKSWERAVLAGAGAALTWLTRPEGMYLVPLFLLACLLRPGRFVGVALPCFLATAFVLAFPLLTYVKRETGHWGVSTSPLSKRVIGLFTGETPPLGYTTTPRDVEEHPASRDKLRYGAVGGAAATFSKTVFFKLFFYVLGPFFLLGLFRLRPPEAERAPIFWLATAAIGYSIPVMLTFAAGTPFSHRFLVIPTALALGVVALGLQRAAGWTRRREALPAFLTLVCVAMAVHDLRVRRADRIGLKLAGRAILDQLGPDRRILTTDRQIETYARGVYVELDIDTTFEQLLSVVAKERIEVIAYNTPELRNLEKGIEERTAARFRFLGEFPSPAARETPPVRLYATK